MLASLESDSLTQTKNISEPLITSESKGTKFYNMSVKLVFICESIFFTVLSIPSKSHAWLHFLDFFNMLIYLSLLASLILLDLLEQKNYTTKLGLVYMKYKLFILSILVKNFFFNFIYVLNQFSQIIVREIPKIIYEPNYKTPYETFISFYILIILLIITYQVIKAFLSIKKYNLRSLLNALELLVNSVLFFFSISLVILLYTLILIDFDFYQNLYAVIYDFITVALPLSIIKRTNIYDNLKCDIFIYMIFKTITTYLIIMKRFYLLYLLNEYDGNSLNISDYEK